VHAHVRTIISSLKTNDNNCSFISAKHKKAGAFERGGGIPLTSGLPGEALANPAADCSDRCADQRIRALLQAWGAPIAPPCMHRTLPAAWRLGAAPVARRVFLDRRAIAPQFAFTL
jgi:hypothetical protein